jgi:hypothetical protein
VLADNDLVLDYASTRPLESGLATFGLKEIPEIVLREVNNRITYSYVKQWKETIILFENEVITEADYPIRKDWRFIDRQQ